MTSLWSPDKIQKLKDSYSGNDSAKSPSKKDNKLDKIDGVITKKISKSKKHHNIPNTTTTTEEIIEKTEPVQAPPVQKTPMDLDLDLEETIMNPGPIIMPNQRSGESQYFYELIFLAKELSKRKKSRKKEGAVKNVDPTPQVDAQNFPVLGSVQTPETSKASIIFGRTANEEGYESTQSKSKSKRKYDSERGENTTEDEKFDLHASSRKQSKTVDINVTPKPKVGFHLIFRDLQLESLFSICLEPVMNACNKSMRTKVINIRTGFQSIWYALWQLFLAKVSCTPNWYADR